MAESSVTHQPLCEAIQMSNFAVVECILQNVHYDVNERDMSGLTPLHRAIAIADMSCDELVRIISMILKHPRFDPYVEDNICGSYVHYAVMATGSVTAPLAALLSDGRIDVNAKNKRGLTGVMSAMHVHTPYVRDKVQVFLQHPDTDLTARDNHGRGVLHHACEAAIPEVVDMLLRDVRCDVNARNEHGETALVIAARSYSERPGEVVTRLLKHPDIDVYAHNNNGDNVLHYACFNLVHVGADVIEVLVEHMREHPPAGSPKSLLSKTGLSVLDSMLMSPYTHVHSLATCELGRTVLNVLLKWDEMVFSSPYTLALAMTYCSYGTCAELLARMAHARGSLHNNETYLHCAVQRNSVKKCSLIMSYNPDLQETWRGLTPFQLAIASRCSPDILELFSRDMSMAKIRKCIEKCSAVGESPYDCAVRLGVRAWVKHFEESDRVKAQEANDAGLGAAFHGTAAHGGIHWSSFKKRCSSKLSTSGTKQQTTPLSALDTLQNCRTFLTVHKVESDSVRDSVIKLLSRVSEVISNREGDSHMSFEVVLAGSMGEDTKTYAADEIDLICVFADTQDLQVEILDNSFKIRCRKQSDWKTLCSKENYLDPRMVSQAFYKLVDAVLELIVEQEESFGNLHLFRYSVQMMDKISQLQLLWTGGAFDGMVIHVDLVPAFVCPPYQPSPALPLGGYSGMFYILAKASRHEHRATDTLPLSLCRAETAILRALPECVRSGYTYAKAMRIAAICHLSARDLRNLGVVEGIACDDYITSYTLKTCLFNLLQRQQGSDNSIPQCKYAWASAIYRELEDCLVTKKIPGWHKDTANFLWCKYCKFERACCQKRQVMLALTRQIREWLRENMNSLLSDHRENDTSGLAAGVKAVKSRHAALALKSFLNGI